MAASGDRRGPDKAERQLNLVLALTDTKVGFSKAELLQAVHGYRQLWDAADTERARDSLDRMFERDKQDLKKLGVPIEAFEPYDESGNNKATRYCIERSLLEMPAGIVFSKSELEVLRAASFVWGQEHLATQSRLARAKLTSLGAGLSVGEVGIYPSMRLRDRSAAPLADAIHAQKVVMFDYRQPDRKISETRTVAPLHLEQADGRWHLLAWDYDREGTRTFLLRRIVGNVKVLARHFDAALFTYVPEIKSELRAVALEHPATLLVRNGTSAYRAFHSRGLSAPEASNGWSELQVPMLDARELAREITGYGADIAVCEPKVLVAHTKELFSLILEQHSRDNEFDGGTPIGGAARSRHRGAAKLDATENVVLMLALVEFLKTERVASVTELAERFDSTETQIRHLVRFLGQAGVPGEEGLYLPQDMIEIDYDALEEDDVVVLNQSVAIDGAPAFTGIEIAGLLSSLQLLSDYLPERYEEDVRSSIAKLTEYSAVSRLSAHDDQRNSLLRPITDAIANGKTLRFQYRAANGGMSERELFPETLDQSTGNWLVEGYCFDRQAHRRFRLDRIEDMLVADATADQRDEIDKANRSVASDAEQRTESRESKQEHNIGRVAVHEDAVNDLINYEIAYDASAGAWRLGNVDLWHQNTELEMLGIAPGEIIFLEPVERRLRIGDWALSALAAY